MKANFYILVLLGSMLISGKCLAQSPGARNEAHRLSVNGLNALAESDYPLAIEAFSRARKLDTRNPQYDIQLGQAYFLNKNYSECKAIVKPLMGRKRAVAEAWQLFGNCLDEQGKSYEAMQMYRKGLRRFPNAGCLYLEMGILEFGRYNDNAALLHWENGIRMNPTFSTNYYFAAKAHLKRGDYFWAVSYAEMYLNLDRMSDQTREMSEILMEGFEKARYFDFQNAFKWKFFQISDPKAKAAGTFLPAPDYARQMDEAFASQLPDSAYSLSIAFLVRLRRFAAFFIPESYPEHPALGMFEWHQIIADLGHFEAYTYWLLYDARPDAFMNWYNKHKDQYEAFESWFLRNNYHKHLKKSVVRTPVKEEN